MRAAGLSAPAVRSRVALVVRATAAPAKPAATASSKVDTSLTPKALGFTMPGESHHQQPQPSCLHVMDSVAVDC